MCGRFTQMMTWAELHALYNIHNSVNLKPNYNVAPTQEIPVVRHSPESEERWLDMLRWGLVPFWAKDVKIGYSMINAMAETVATKPAFRDAFKSRRCIIPADGFYEWKKLDPKTKQPYRIVMKDRSIFGFAGLWDRWTDKASGETIQSCTIITTEPNTVCAPIHNRMPVILERRDYAAWLGETETDRDALLAMLKPYPADQMEAYACNPAVGSVKNNDRSLVESLS
jgi:putative SOS response-associated peptidase YedK